MPYDPEAGFNNVLSMCVLPGVHYSMDYRQDGAGNPYGWEHAFDCSSLLSWALYEAGMSEAWGYNPWFTTYDMGSWLGDYGWERHDPFGDWAAGDILVRNYGFLDQGYSPHTEMVYDGANRYCMGAHTDRIENVDDQVSVNFYSVYGAWEDLWRWPGGATPTPPDVPPATPSFQPSGHPWSQSGMHWYYNMGGGGFERDSDEAKTNAANVWWFLFNAGWKLPAAAAVIGNMQNECGLNPALQEVGGEGAGLVQWTPASVLLEGEDIIYGHHSPWTDGTMQMNVFLAEYMQTNYAYGEPFARDVGFAERRQWYPSTGAPYGFSLPGDTTWYQFSQDETHDMEWMVQTFIACYLRPAYDLDLIHYNERVENARYWYDYLSSYTLPGTGGGSTGGAGGAFSLSSIALWPRRPRIL